VPSQVTLDTGQVIEGMASVTTSSTNGDRHRADRPSIETGLLRLVVASTDGHSDEKAFPFSTAQTRPAGRVAARGRLSAPQLSRLEPSKFTDRETT